MCDFQSADDSQSAEPTFPLWWTEYFRNQTVCWKAHLLFLNQKRQEHPNEYFSWVRPHLKASEGHSDLVRFFVSCGKCHPILYLVPVTEVFESGTDKRCLSRNARTYFAVRIRLISAKIFLERIKISADIIFDQQNVPIFLWKHSKKCVGKGFPVFALPLVPSASMRKVFVEAFPLIAIAASRGRIKGFLTSFIFVTCTTKWAPRRRRATSWSMSKPATLVPLYQIVVIQLQDMHYGLPIHVVSWWKVRIFGGCSKHHCTVSHTGIFAGQFSDELISPSGKSRWFLKFSINCSPSVSVTTPL